MNPMTSPVKTPRMSVMPVRESVLFIGTRFSNLYTYSVDTPAEAA
jgi:hypothetical protein